MTARALGQHVDLLLAILDAARFTVVVDARVPGNGVDPRQHGLAAAIGVADLVNPQPRLLEQVVGKTAADELAPERSGGVAG